MNFNLNDDNALLCMNRAPVFTPDFLQSCKGFSDLYSSQLYWQGENIFDPVELKSILEVYNKNRHFLRPAKIGRGLNKNRVVEIRNDFIHWIDTDDVRFNFLWKLLEIFYIKAKQELFIPLKRNESQLALYPKGHFYLKHVDQNKLKPQRILTFVLYLNDWKEGDGGELILYIENKEIVLIKPKMNQMILFSSPIEHEVLVAKKDRKSITSWYRDDLI